jgi:hypothetical protein
LNALGARRFLVGLGSAALIAAVGAGWYCLRLNYWITFFAHPADLGFRFAVQRLGVLVLFTSPLIGQMFYMRRMERFSWSERRSIPLTLAIGLSWALLGWAVGSCSRADFIDWTEATLSVAGLGAWIPALIGICVHRRLER